MHRVWLASLGLLGLPLAASAVDADPFDPSASIAHGSGTPATDSPTLTEGGVSGGAFATIGEDLVVLETESESISVVPHAFATTLYGGWTFEDKARIDVLVPVYWHTRVTTEEPFAGAALGDIVVQGNILLRENDAETFAVSVLPAIGLPTGREKALLAKGFHMKLRAAVGGLLAERVGYAANAGFVLQRGRSFEDVAVGSAFVGSAGVWLHADDHFRVGADYDFSIGTSNAPGFTNTLATSHLFAQMVSDEGVGVTVGAGRGLAKGVGAPDWRIFAAITYARTLRDADGDTIPDKEDACPLDPEDFDLWQDLDGCPEIDNDEDTILDVDDTCPNEAEDFDDWEDLDGCPDPDNDGDGLLDVDDSCPIDPGPESLLGCPDNDDDGLADLVDQCPADPGPVALIGCPDTDGDQIPDYRDACPEVPRLEDEPLANSNGCPRKAFIVGDRIRITERVLFETGKSVIREESFPLLDSVVEALGDYPQIETLEVAGHTDNVGSERYNLGLSRRRAASVRTFLVDHGVDADRLTSQGYGETEPISTNFTSSGRQANRRVEFRITGQAEGLEEVATNLGKDKAGLTVRMPEGSPFSLLEVDGAETSPRAPVRSLIVDPGLHTVRVTDEARDLDFEAEVDVAEGRTAVIDVPASVIGNPDGRQIIDLPAIVPTVPEGAPLAVPEGDGMELPTEGEQPDGEGVELPTEGAQPDADGETPADGERPTEGSEGAEPAPPDDIDLGQLVPGPGDDDAAEPPADDADIQLPDAAGPDELDDGVRTPGSATPEPEPEPEPTEPVITTDGSPWGTFAEPATGGDSDPVPGDAAQPAADPDDFPVGTVDDPWGAASTPTPIETAPTEVRATDTAPADTPSEPVPDTQDGVIVGPGFGVEVDPAEEKARLKAEKKAARDAARSAKAAAKAAKKAAKAGEDAPPPLVDPSTLQGGDATDDGAEEPQPDDDPWSQDD